jgi:hypothetical protein
MVFNVDIIDCSIEIKKKVDELCYEKYKTIYELHKCVSTNNIYLKCSFYLPENIDDNYDEFRTTLLNNKDLKKVTKIHNVEIYNPAEVTTTIKPSCKIIHDCFMTENEYRGETIKKYMLGAMLLVIYQKVFSLGLLNQKQTIFVSMITYLFGEKVMKESGVSTYMKKLIDFILKQINTLFMVENQYKFSLNFIFIRNIQDFYSQNLTTNINSIRDINRNLQILLENKITDKDTAKQTLKREIENYIDNSQKQDKKQNKNLIDCISSTSSTTGLFFENGLITRQKDYDKYSENIIQCTKKRDNEKYITTCMNSEFVQLFEDKEKSCMIIKIRKDKNYIIDINEIFRLNFKNYNYNIDEKLTENRYTMYDELLYSCFKIDYNEQITLPYVYVQEIKKDRVILKSGNTTKTVTMNFLSQALNTNNSMRKKNQKDQQLQRLYFNNDSTLQELNRINNNQLGIYNEEKKTKVRNKLTDRTKQKEQNLEKIKKTISKPNDLEISSILEKKNQSKDIANIKSQTQRLKSLLQQRNQLNIYNRKDKISQVEQKINANQKLVKQLQSKQNAARISSILEKKQQKSNNQLIQENKTLNQLKEKANISEDKNRQVDKRIQQNTNIIRQKIDPMLQKFKEEEFWFENNHNAHDQQVEQHRKSITKTYDDLQPYIQYMTPKQQQTFVSLSKDINNDYLEDLITKISNDYPGKKLEKKQEKQGFYLGKNVKGLLNLLST